MEEEVVENRSTANITPNEDSNSGEKIRRQDDGPKNSAEGQAMIIKSRKRDAESESLEKEDVNRSAQEQDLKMEKLVKLLRGMSKKSLFSANSKKELNLLKISNDEELLLKRIKLERIVLFKKWWIDGNDVKEMKRISPDFYRIRHSFVGGKEESDILKKFFNHPYSNCGPNMCDIEACEEINSLLSCFENCKATDNVDCTVCVREIKYRMWECEMDKARKTLKTADAEIRLDFINHHKNFNENIIISSDYKNDEDELSRVLTLFHHENCSIVLNGKSQECKYNFCRELRNILNHQKECTNGLFCKFKGCLEVARFSVHLQEEVNCSVCEGFHNEFLQFLKEKVIVLSELRLKVQELEKGQPKLINPRDLSETLKDFFSNNNVIFES